MSVCEECSTGTNLILVAAAAAAAAATAAAAAKEVSVIYGDEKPTKLQELNLIKHSCSCPHKSQQRRSTYNQAAGGWRQNETRLTIKTHLKFFHT